MRLPGQQTLPSRRTARVRPRADNPRTAGQGRDHVQNLVQPRVREEVRRLANKLRRARVGPEQRAHRACPEGTTTSETHTTKRLEWSMALIELV